MELEKFAISLKVVLRDAPSLNVGGIMTREWLLPESDATARNIEGAKIRIISLSARPYKAVSSLSKDEIVQILILQTVQVIAGFILLLSLMQPSIAGSRADAGSAYDNGHYAYALHILRPLADQGDAFAESILGLAYSEGHGVPQNFAKAAKWYRRAAQQGFAPAQNQLGLVYLKGQGVSRSVSEAMYWFRKAAIQGFPAAEFRVGAAYWKGFGAPRDQLKAVEWFQKAATHGNLKAVWFLGLAYGSGRGVPQNFAKAARWYRVGAEQGDAACQGGLGALYADGRGVPRDYVLAYKWLSLSVASGDSQMPQMHSANGGIAGLLDALTSRMTPQQIAKAQSLAREWKPRAAQVAHSNTDRPPIQKKTPSRTREIEVPLKLSGGVFVVPIELNGAIRLNFTVDSGASDVTVPLDVFETLKRTGTIKDSDLLGSQTYVLADGSKAKSAIFRIRSLQVGEVVLHNVTASISPSQGLPLLGQSFLSRFKSWSIDNTNHQLRLEPVINSVQLPQAHRELNSVKKNVSADEMAMLLASLVVGQKRCGLEVTSVPLNVAVAKRGFDLVSFEPDGLYGPVVQVKMKKAEEFIAALGRKMGCEGISETVRKFLPELVK